MARKRRPAAETKAEILDAAQEQLVQHGPAELRLDVIAAEVGISRQAILHHFGDREGLMREVVSQAWLGLFRDLSELSEAEPDELIGRIDEVTRTRGNARLGAWLLLSNTGLPEEVFTGALAHLPEKLAPGEDPREARYKLLLVGAALFGDAIFGQRLRQAIGLPDSEEDRKDFQAWMGGQLE
ncbi:MAG: TetR/AcrR family transcriptional regulator [Proteobacteria bacterium]|nr:TetR/AcrR family transcriptional regulator [Pseudomonadota bacterium]MCP4920429.1 TetR/AcrR family transcriptional regulator [Pseudomonadota bacterium]